jgi:hypothetical protein
MASGRLEGFIANLLLRGCADMPVRSTLDTHNNALSDAEIETLDLAASNLTPCR